MLQVKLGKFGYCSLSGGYVGWPTSWVHPWSYWFEGLEVEVLPRDLLRSVGHANSEVPDFVTTISGLRPTASSGTDQFGRWAGFVSNARTFFTDWQFDRARGDPSKTTEHPTTHFNLSGTLFAGQSAYNRYRPQQDYPAEDYPIITSCKVVASGNRFTLAMSEPSATLPLTKSWRFQGGDFLSLLESGSFDLISVPNGDWRTTSLFKNVQSEVIDGYIQQVKFDVIHWSVRNSDGLVSATAFAIKLAIKHDLNPTYVGLDEVFNVVSVAPVRFCTVYRSYWSNYWMSPGSDPASVPYTPIEIDDPLWASASTFWGGGWEDKTLTTFFTGGMADSPDLNGLVGLGSGGEFRHMLHGRDFLAFKDLGTQLLPNVAAGFSLSSQEGVDAALSSISSNSLENLSQLGELMRVVDVGRILALIRFVRQRKYVSIVLALLDALTSAELVYSFSLRPTYLDSVDFSRKAARILNQINKSSYVEARGKFVLAVPDDFNSQTVENFQGVTVYHRSKVQFRINPDSYLSAVIPVRSFGLLPTWSQLWDFVPFSFVLDWFTGLGTNMERLEDQAMMLALDVRISTHSARVTWDFPAAWLEEFNLFADQAPNAKSAGFVLYDREVLSILPVLCPTRLPYYGVGRLPDWEVPTSLFWTLIRNR